MMFPLFTEETVCVIGQPEVTLYDLFRKHGHMVTATCSVKFVFLGDVFSCVTMLPKGFSNDQLSSYM